MKRLSKMFLACQLALAAVWSAVPAQAQTVVKVGYPPAWSAVEAAIPFGETLGFFKEEGIRIDYVSIQGTGVLLPQVANGSVEFGIMNPDLAVIAASKGEPFPVKFFYNFYPRNIFEFVVLQDSPIQSLKDLKGKKLGVGALTWGNLPMSRLMLRDAGITWMKDIEVLPVGVGPASWARLKNGSVDALNLPSTQHEMMAQAGTAIRRLPIPEQFQNVFSNGLAASDKLIQDNPKLIEGMGRAIAKSQVACMANFEACVRAYWQIDPSSKPAADKQDEWVRTFVAVNKRTAEIGQLSQRDGRHGAYTADDWKNFVAKMKEGEQIANDNFDISSLYTDRFVKAFNDFDLEAVRAAARNVKQ